MRWHIWATRGLYTLSIVARGNLERRSITKRYGGRYQLNYRLLP